MVIHDPRRLLSAPPPVLLLPAVASPSSPGGRVVSLGVGRKPSRALPLDTVTCADALDFLRTLPEGSIDMILTSPPYDNLRQYKGYSWNFEGIAQQMYRVLKTGGVAVWVVADSTVNGSETLTSFEQALYFKRVGFDVYDTMIWEKSGTHPNIHRRYSNMFEYMFVFSKSSPAAFNPLKQRNKLAGQSTTGGKRQRDGEIHVYKRGRVSMTVQKESVLSNVWRIPSGYNLSSNDPECFEHPATFPEELARRHILTWSNPGDVVLDPFSGSGTTLKIARNLGRRFIGVDISQEYVDLSLRRLANTDPFQPTTHADGTVQLSLFG